MCKRLISAVAFDCLPATGCCSLAATASWIQMCCPFLSSLTLSRTLQLTVMGCVAMMVVGVLIYFFLRKRPVYLVDFSVYRAPDR